MIHSGWAIDTDFLAGGLYPSRVGWGCTAKDLVIADFEANHRRLTLSHYDIPAAWLGPNAVRFRIVRGANYDESCYEGIVSRDWWEDKKDANLAYHIQVFASIDIGGEVQFRVCDLENDELVKRCREHGCIDTDKDGIEWISIYG